MPARFACSNLFPANGFLPGEGSAAALRLI
jgi:hypothetical protein